MRNLERAEDISPQAMEAGIKWSWETFPQYLDAVARVPKGINYMGYIGHSALRTYVMGERAFEEEATSEDLAAMKRELRSALHAGAAGFTSSRSRAHQTPDGRPVASRLANWDEVKQLVALMGEMRAGVFEIAREDIDRNPERMRDYITRLKTLALDTSVPITFGLTHSRKAPQTWRPLFQMVDETNAAGGKMLVQGHSRSIRRIAFVRDHHPVR
jgi:N-acyl-D-aspartate/D-glutamate deacylase